MKELHHNLTHNIERRCVIGQENIRFLQARPCIFPDGAVKGLRPSKIVVIIIMLKEMGRERGRVGGERQREE